MIKIKRSKCPPTLKNSPLKGRRYNAKKVVKALWTMQHEKCCYCEMKIPEKGHQKWVEHFRPKSVFKGLKNDWRNLLLACAQCNGKKSDKFPVELTVEPNEPKVVYFKVDSEGRPLIIDPSHPDIDPEDDIDFAADDDEEDEDLGFAIPKNDSDRGRLTIEVIGLSGPFYTKERAGYYLNVLYPAYLNLLRAKQTSDSDQLQIYKQTIEGYLSAKRRFTGFSRAFARHKRLDQRFGLRIPVGSDG